MIRGRRQRHRRESVFPVLHSSSAERRWARRGVLPLLYSPFEPTCAGPTFCNQLETRPTRRSYSRPLTRKLRQLAVHCTRRCVRIDAPIGAAATVVVVRASLAVETVVAPVSIALVVVPPTEKYVITATTFESVIARTTVYVVIAETSL